MIDEPDRGKGGPNLSRFVWAGLGGGFITGALAGLLLGAILGNWRIWVTFGASLGFAGGLIVGLILVARAEENQDH